MSSRYDIYVLTEYLRTFRDDIDVLTEYLRTLKSKINSLCYNADKELTKAKSICRGKQLDKFFDKYRKDKLLKKHFNEIIKLTMDNIYLYNKTSDIETLRGIFSNTPSSINIPHNNRLFSCVPRDDVILL